MATTTTIEPVIGKKRKFPLLSDTHGIEMAIVIVGNGAKQRAFHIHRLLLEQVSQYFDRALNGDFNTSAGTIRLTRHCPVAFEAVYQWLYSGRKLVMTEFTELRDFDRHYRDNQVGHSMIWLHLYKLADETMIPELKVYAYKSLIRLYSLGEGDMYAAAHELVAELFDSESPQPVLQDYFARHTAWLLYCRCISDAPFWEKTWQINSEFATMVLRHIVAMSIDRDNSDAMHPSKDPKFAVESVFPAETHE